jgi:DNA-binding MarR family transcriptional regulator
MIERSGRAVEHPACDGARVAPDAGAHLPDDLVDALDRSIRRLRRVMLRPIAAQIPVPSLGRPLDVAKIFACDAVAELSAVQEAVTVKDVAALLDLEHSTVSRLLTEAEAEGLLVRAPDPQDRRRTTVALTDLGRDVVVDATLMTRFTTRLLLAEWTRDDVVDLQRQLGRLADTVATRLDAIQQAALHELEAPHLAAAAAQVARDAQRRARTTT